MNLVELRDIIRGFVQAMMNEDWFQRQVWKGDAVSIVQTRECTFGLMCEVPHRRGTERAQAGADLAAVHHTLIRDGRFARGTDQDIYVSGDPMQMPYADPAYTAYPLMVSGPRGHTDTLLNLVFNRSVGRQGRAREVLLATAQSHEAIGCFMRVREWVTNNGISMTTDLALDILTEAYLFIASVRLCQAQLSTTCTVIADEMRLNGVKSWEAWHRLTRLDPPYFASSVSPTKVRSMATVNQMDGDDADAELITYLYDVFMMHYADAVVGLQRGIAQAETTFARSRNVTGLQLSHILSQVVEALAVTMVMHPDSAPTGDESPTDEVPKKKGTP